MIRKLGDSAWATPAELQHYLETGGLPGICFRRDSEIRRQLFEQHLDTLLGRDLQYLYETSVSQNTLQTLYSMIIVNQGRPLHFTALARELSLSAPTIKKIIRAFEGLFLLRELNQTYFAEDLGLAHFAMTKTGKLVQSRSIRSEVLSLIYGELRFQAYFYPKGTLSLSSYTTRGGADVPFVLSSDTKKECLGITVDLDSHVTEKSLKSLTSFKKKAPPHAKVIALHQGQNPYIASNQTPCIPISWIF